ncbi:FlaR protein (FlaR) [Alishewanella agri BL06]|uniref:FlaR protein (FlaR) n=1 Tax=Alishewanella agri BL06 TaxID=1195246 RepID=I9P5Z6_9ALTE|nr:UDP-2,4-diacetamido-2,4,6-trideoxy-beta-L-altropyranose hydrolase [Alishewanella agri]EIW90274.1 FlaR protein (FlaR) [Alishewanella agri BL06]
MRALLRADASVTLGSGHIMRCLTLASAMQQHGVTCEFICRQSDGNLITWLRDQNINVMTIPQTINSEEEDAQFCLSVITGHYQLLVVDHYQLSAPFCQILRPYCTHIMVIDDLANRQHDCDLLLDQNLFPDSTLRYRHLVPPSCTQLLGPRYALLRDEFYQVHNPRQTQHILVGFGGSDEQNLTKLAVQAIDKLKPMQITADIVIGANNPWRAMLEQQIACLPNVQLHVQCKNMATLMRRARLMLGAGGATHWERCICGLPGLIVTVAENQQATTAYLNELGACVWLGQAAEMSAEFFAEQLCYYLSQPALLEEIGQQAKNLVPAHAGTPLVIEQIFNVVAGI